MTPEDVRWLDAAARLALPYRGTTAENPTVGALIVSPDGRLLGRGVTARGGRPHAEPQAIAMAGLEARGATLYVTLEPCAHWGRTPPCADAITAAGLARVVLGLVDPDPRTSGESIGRMRQAGLVVDVAPDHPPSRHLHEGHVSREARGRPFVTIKLAVSRDGMIGRRNEAKVAISGGTAWRWTHMQRAMSDAVMVGAGTARIDRPLLSVRLPGLEDRKPLRVILAGTRPVPEDVIHLGRETGQQTVVIDGFDLATALSGLAERGVASLLVEAGGVLSDALLDAGLVDRFHLIESDIEIGAGGVPATVHPSLPQRLEQLGFVCVAARALGCDRLRTFERPHGI